MEEELLSEEEPLPSEGEGHRRTAEGGNGELSGPPPLKRSILTRKGTLALHADDEEYSPSSSDGGGGGHATLARHYAAAQPVALGKRKTEDGSAEKRARKRRTVHQRIRPEDRCGRCMNCLNPQRKQACSVARERQRREVQRQDSGSSSGGVHAASASAAAAAPTPPSAAAAPPPPQPTEDPTVLALKAILSNDGAVAQARHIPRLLGLLRQATALQHRTALLTVLKVTPRPLLAEAVAQGAVPVLSAWLQQWVEDGKAKMVAKTLDCLAGMPVTLAALQSCDVGKIVGKLRKNDGFEAPLHKQAAGLVAAWKRLVAQEGGGGAAPTTAPPAASRLLLLPAHGPASPSSAAPLPCPACAGADPRPRAQPHPHVIAACSHAAHPAPAAPARSAAAGPGQAAAGGRPALPATAGKPAKPPVNAAGHRPVDRQLSGQLSGGLVVDDVDMFKSADASKQRAPVPTVRKVRLSYMPIHADVG